MSEFPVQERKFEKNMSKHAQNYRSLSESKCQKVSFYRLSLQKSIRGSAILKFLMDYKQHV